MSEYREQAIKDVFQMQLEAPIEALSLIYKQIAEKERAAHLRQRAALKLCERELVIMCRAIAPQANVGDAGNRFADQNEAVIAARAALSEAV